MELTTASRKALLGTLATIGLAAGARSIGAAGEPPGILGAWSLESFVEREKDGEFEPRFGLNPVGYLMYTPSGRVSAVLGAAHRPPFLSPDGQATTNAERQESVHNFLAYAGRYEVHSDHVLHHVESSIFTDLIGVTLKRGYVLDGNTLTITTMPPYIWGTASKLVWRRT
jgi:hypothetical protein